MNPSDTLTVLGYAWGGMLGLIFAAAWWIIARALWRWRTNRKHPRRWGEYWLRGWCLVGWCLVPITMIVAAVEAAARN